MSVFDTDYEEYGYDDDDWFDEYDWWQPTSSVDEYKYYYDYDPQEDYYDS